MTFRHFFRMLLIGRDLMIEPGPKGEYGFEELVLVGCRMLNEALESASPPFLNSVG